MQDTCNGMPEPAAGGSRSDLVSVVALVGVALIVRLLFLAWLPDNAVSADMRSWVKVVDLLREGLNPYVHSRYLNWPPLWLGVLDACSRVSGALGLSVECCIRAFLWAAETALIVVLWRVLRRKCGLRESFRWVLWGVVLNPVCLLLVCQHGNFDVLVGLFVLLAVASLLAAAQAPGAPLPWLGGCLWLGVGILTKTVPLCLFPLLLPGMRRLPRKWWGVGAALFVGPALLGMGAILWAAPVDVFEKVICYRSIGGFFGVTGIMAMAGAPGMVADVYAVVVLLVFGALAMTLSVWLYRGALNGSGLGAKLAGAGQDVRMIMAALCLLMFMPVFGAGYGSQYIHWYLPLGVLLYGYLPAARRWLRVLYLVSIAVYAVEYAFFSSHGAFVYHLNPSGELGDVCLSLSTQTNQTWIRMPWFAGSAAFLLWCLRQVALPEGEFTTKYAECAKRGTERV